MVKWDVESMLKEVKELEFWGDFRAARTAIVRHFPKSARQPGRFGLVSNASGGQTAK
jgi:hypothetical protein